MKKLVLICLCALPFAAAAFAEGWKADPDVVASQTQRRPEYIYQEERVPEYTLPDPLVTNAGKPVLDAHMWRETRRPEILELFKEHVYGRAPGRPADMTFEVFDDTPNALGGKARRMQIRVNFTGKADGPAMDILLYLPAGKAAAPVFIGPNFNGNQTIHPDPAIRITESWTRDKATNNRATEASRGS